MSARQYMVGSVYMARGPKGEWRPTGDIACAVHVGRIATGEIEDNGQELRPDHPGYKRERAIMGGKARAESLTPERRKEIAKTAAAARWKP